MIFCRVRIESVLRLPENRCASVEKRKRDLPGNIRFDRLAFGHFGFSGGYGVFSLFCGKKAQDILSGIRLRSVCV